MKMSAASLRAENYPNANDDWFCGFAYTPAHGLGYEEGVHRRDPSSVIKVGDTYYVYYTKSVGPHFSMSVKDLYSKKYPWDYADIWCASSSDGVHWTEQGCAVHRGGKGEYDERTVCTPDVLAHEGKYYLVYQALPQGEYNAWNENVAMSVADSPLGPWKKTCQNILKPMDGGKWFGDVDNYNGKEYQGLTHDPMLMYYNGKFHLYYKCGGQKWGLFYAGPDTRMGVATSDNVEGPYVHSEYNPITNSGHETLLWHYNGGIACLLNRDGPEKDTIQFAKDGINFEIMSHITDTPQAGGAFRCEDSDRTPLEGVRWGLCHCDERASDWNYIVRFDVDKRDRSYKIPYQYPKANTGGIF